jgi:5-methylcytosine-specific restriction endonuclease McrA
MDPNSQPKAIVLLMRQQDGKCFYCGRRMKYHPKVRNIGRAATIDHIIPRSKGGAKGPMVNGVAACKRCNNERGDRDARLFLLEKQGLLETTDG